MKTPKPKWFILTLAAVASVAFIVSCATIDRVIVAPPMIPGAKYVGMDTCGTCHEKQVKDFKLASHARVTIPGEGPRTEGQGCESCHGPGSLHVDDGTGKFIVNPGTKPEACFQCHLEKSAEFSLQYHHPVKEGRMNCIQCHDPHGRDVRLAKGMVVGRVNETCAQCHREQTQPHVFEHEALREGCTICHNVHGSINDKMLVERDNNLCLKCHAQVASPALPGATVIGKMPHAGFSATEFLSQGTCYSAGCHTAVHGSNINPHLRY
jgi:predicted CXXCH cytochrome family protein